MGRPRRNTGSSSTPAPTAAAATTITTSSSLKKTTTTTGTTTAAANTTTTTTAARRATTTTTTTTTPTTTTTTTAAPTSSDPPPLNHHLVRTIIAREFDFQIYLKQREIATIQEELDKGRMLLHQIQTHEFPRFPPAEQHLLLPPNSQLASSLLNQHPINPGHRGPGRPPRRHTAHSLHPYLMTTATGVGSVMSAPGVGVGMAVAATTAPLHPSSSSSSSSVADHSQLLPPQQHPPTSQINSLATPHSLLPPPPPPQAPLPPNHISTSTRSSSASTSSSFLSAATPMANNNTDRPLSSNTRNSGRRRPAPPRAGPPTDPMIGPHQVNGVGPKVLFARQSNGDLVKMRCPTCSRSDFSNMQGFINHCNLRHKMPLNSHIEAANMCGVRVNEDAAPDTPDVTAAFRKVAPSSSVVAAANPTSSSSTGGKPTTLTIKGFSSDVNSDGTTPSVKIMVNPSQLKHQIKVYNEIVDMDDDGNETADDEDDKDFKLNKRKSGGRGSASPRKQRGPTASSQLKAVTTTTTVSSIAREVSTRASAAAAAAIHVASSSLSKLADVASLVVGGSGDGGTVMNPSIVDGLGGGGSMDMMDLDTMVSAGHLPVGEGKEVEEVQDEMQMMSSASSASMECLPALSTLDALPPPPPSFRNVVLIPAVEINHPHPLVNTINTITTSKYISNRPDSSSSFSSSFRGPSRIPTINIDSKKASHAAPSHVSPSTSTSDFNGSSPLTPILSAASSNQSNESRLEAAILARQKQQKHLNNVTLPPPGIIHNNPPSATSSSSASNLELLSAAAGLENDQHSEVVSSSSVSSSLLSAKAHVLDYTPTSLHHKETLSSSTTNIVNKNANGSSSSNTTTAITVTTASTSLFLNVAAPPLPLRDVAPEDLVPEYIRDKGSRFHIRKKVLVGNVCQFLGMRGEKPLFRWMVYLRGPPLDPDVSTFVRKVRFYLHPDYKPNDVVVVTGPPFQLTRTGWGEFPVRLEIHFVDRGKLNRPVNVIHMLKLFDGPTDEQYVANERPVDLELDRNTVFVPSRLAAGTTGFTSFVDHNKRFKPKLVVNVPGDGGDMTGSAGVETSSVTAAAAALTRFTTNVSTSGVVSFSLEASVSVENHSDMAKDVSNAVMTSKSSAQQQQQPTRLACFYCGQFVQNSQQSGCDASGDVSVLSSNSWAGHATCREKILQKRGLKTFPPPPLKPTGNTATTTASSSNIISVIKQAGVTAVDSLSDDAMDVVIVDEDDIVGNGCGDSDYSDLDLIQLEDYGAIVSDPAVVLLSQTLRQVEPTTFTSIFAAELAGVMDLFAQRAKRTPRRSTPLFRPSVNNNTNTAVEASIVAAVSSSLQSSSSSATTTTSTTATVAADVGNNASTGEVGEKVSSGFEDNRNIMAIRMKYMQISPRTLITDPKYVQNDKYFFKNTTFEDVEYERLGVFVSLVLRIHIQKLVAERFSV